MLVASAYPEWTKIGGGTRNFLTYGGYARDASNESASYLFPRGIVRDPNGFWITFGQAI